MPSAPPPRRADPGATRPPSRRRFVTLRGEYDTAEVDMELPTDRPVGALLPDLIKALNWPAADGDQPLRYRLKTEAGRFLEEGQTLLEAGVENSDVLWITLAEEAAPGPRTEEPARRGREATEDEGPVTGFTPVAAPIPSPRDRRGSLAPPRPPRLMLREPCLVSPNGTIFVLGPPPITIGRASRGAKPEVDLTDIDPDFSSSRFHAEIQVEDGVFLLQPRRTTNGTFLNGVEVSSEERRPLQDGDVIQFGLEGVKLTFFSGRDTELPPSFFH
jgi:hypothetical protein